MVYDRELDQENKEMWDFLNRKIVPFLNELVSVVPTDLWVVRIKKLMQDIQSL
jgi:hypothetical protein